MKANIKLSLSRLSVLALLALLRNVVAKMTGNANFTTPAVTLAAMTTQADTLEAAIEAATDGSKQSRILRNNEVATAQAMLRTQADYVRMISAGDKAKLQSSGYDLVKDREPVGLPGTPIIRFARMTGKKGQVELRWTAQPGADSYHVRMTDKDPLIEANWQIVGVTTKSRHVVDNLESYKAHWFCISAIAAAGEGAQSEPAVGVAA